jgi:hypothetical protein
MIKSLHDSYFQKSRVFLYPLLSIPRGTSVTPINTYTAWYGKNDHKDCKLFCLYHLRDDKEFKDFEKAKLFSSQYFEDFYEVEENKALYIFNLIDHKSDIELFLDGKYSKLSELTKTSIQSYFVKSKKNFVYIDSYLNPSLYYGIYSKLLDCDPKVLKTVGELCSKPDLEKETSKNIVKELDLSKFKVTSS